MRILISILVAGCAAVSSARHQGDTIKTVAAAGSIRGSLHDANGWPLPGATVTAASGDFRRTTITGASGSYELSAVPAGTYAVTAALVGFMTGVRNDVAVRSAEPSRVDFVLCLSGLEHIDWIALRDLHELWTRADVVARVVIAGTHPRVPGCGQSAVSHSATIREVLKDRGGRANGQTVTFVQEIWADERRPYATGEEMVIFLTGTEPEFYRVGGPTSVFRVSGDKIVGRSYLGTTGTMALDEFLAKLRTFEKE